ncbi:MAG: hypothetical protein VX444_04965 [Pseudomonadota bacterium]|nr:hypothetical protein [Cognatishimia activa]MEE2944504.1 hypothetical protein [Pseudomonadota bacterium]
MLAKIVLLFLAGMAVLAMFGKLSVPGKKTLQKQLNARRCSDCGRFQFGKGPCPCRSKKG